LIDGDEFYDAKSFVARRSIDEFFANHKPKISGKWCRPSHEEICLRRAVVTTWLGFIFVKWSSFNQRVDAINVQLGQRIANVVQNNAVEVDLYRSGMPI
jgi:hypothetical protein